MGNTYQRLERIVRKHRYAAKMAVEKFENADWMIRELMHLTLIQPYLPPSEELAKLAQNVSQDGNEADLGKLKAHVSRCLQRKKDYADCFWRSKHNLIDDLSSAGVLECVLWDQLPDPDGVNDDYGPVREAVYNLTDPRGVGFAEEIGKKVRQTEGNNSGHYICELAISDEVIDHYYKRVEELRKDAKS